MKTNVTIVVLAVALFAFAGNTQASTITAIALNRGFNAGTETTNGQYENPNVFLTSITVGGTPFTFFSPLASNTLAPNEGFRFWASEGGSDPGSDANAIADDDMMTGLLNVAGKVFFNASYNSGDLIYMTEIGGGDTVGLTLIDSSGDDISATLGFVAGDWFAPGIVQSILYPAAWAPSMNVLAFTEGEFSSITGTVAGMRLDTSSVDPGSVGTVAVPEPSSAFLLFGLGLGLVRRARRHRRKA